MKRTIERYKQMIEEAVVLIEDVQCDENTEYASDFDRALTDMVYRLSNKLDELNTMSERTAEQELAIFDSYADIVEWYDIEDTPQDQTSHQATQGQKNQ